MSNLKLPYPRPQTLSDPFHDNTPDRLASLLGTDDDDLQWHDYQMLLGPFLPAGTYEESAYFLPLAFDYILSHDDQSADLIPSLVWFVSEYSPQLQRDRALDSARSRISDCLDQWTSRFIVMHDDGAACRKKGWNIRYRDHVPQSATVIEALNCLVRFKRHEDLAVSFFLDLANAESDPVKSAWFLEIARRHVSRDIDRPPRRHPVIRPLMDDVERANKHAVVVRQSLPGYREDATYWLDLFALLGIAT
jgi:hypothetical protein